MKLKDKIALITGASRGIGRAIAIKFAQEGAKVIINYNNSEEDANKVKIEIENMKREAYLIKADVSKNKEISSMIEKVIDKYGKIDILVNNAGIFPDSRINFSDYNEEIYNKIMNINLKSMFFCSQKAAKYMVKNKEGNIINLSSNAGIIPKKEKGIIYGLSKSGVIYLTKSLALTLAPFIRVNCIAPGYTKTDMTSYLNDEKIRKEIEDKIPLKKINEPEDIADLALFFASDDSKNITGETIIIDGGFSLQN